MNPSGLIRRERVLKVLKCGPFGCFLGAGPETNLVFTYVGGPFILEELILKVQPFRGSS